jgi:hypothetical protein
MVGLMMGLILGLISWLTQLPIFGLIGGLILGLIVGLILGLNFVLIGALDEIRPIEALDVSLPSLKRGLNFGLIGGLNFGPILGLILGLIGVLIFGTGELIEELIGGLIAGSIMGLIFGLIIGLENNQIRVKELPNQGIWDSLKNTFFIALIASPAGMLVFILPDLASGQDVDWQQFLAGGLFFSLSSLFSLQSVLQHGALRVILWRSGVSPWNYADFLDYASELRLVQKLGGRYRFFHDLLREHLIGDRPLPQRPTSPSLFRVLIGLVVALVAGLLVSTGLLPITKDIADLTTPALQLGDWGFLNFLSYRFRSPQRFDLIGYRGERGYRIKWIVGLPGDRITVSVMNYSRR